MGVRAAVVGQPRPAGGAREHHGRPCHDSPASPGSGSAGSGSAGSADRGAGGSGSGRPARHVRDPDRQHRVGQFRLPPGGGRGGDGRGVPGRHPRDQAARRVEGPDPVQRDRQRHPRRAEGQGGVGAPAEPARGPQLPVAQRDRLPRPPVVCGEPVHGVRVDPAGRPRCGRDVAHGHHPVDPDPRRAEPSSRVTVRTSTPGRAVPAPSRDAVAIPPRTAVPTTSANRGRPSGPTPGSRWRSATRRPPGAPSSDTRPMLTRRPHRPPAAACPPSGARAPVGGTPPASGRVGADRSPSGGPPP